MDAFFDDKGHPKVRLRVGGTKNKRILEAILDTGFDGYLSLPISMAVQLGLELIGTDTVQYADGRTANELVFSVVVKLDKSEQLVPATLTGGIEALAGTALVSGYAVTFDFPKERIFFK